MGSYSIYSNEIWKRMLEKYSDLKDLAIQCGCENNPQKAKKIRQELNNCMGKRLSYVENKLAIELVSIEFAEQDFLDMVISTGREHYNNYSDDYAISSFRLVLSDFEDSYQDWLKEIQKRDMQEKTSFEDLYEIFLNVIALKIKYKIPYTKLFIRRLIKESSMPKKRTVEIKQYFLAKEPEILPEINCELIE